MILSAITFSLHIRRSARVDSHEPGGRGLNSFLSEGAGFELGASSDPIIDPHPLGQGDRLWGKGSRAALMALCGQREGLGRQEQGRGRSSLLLWTKMDRDASGFFQFP